MTTFQTQVRNDPPNSLARGEDIAAFAWNVKSAGTPAELAAVLFAASSGLKTQVLASPVLAAPHMLKLKDRLSEIADEIHGLQFDALVGPEA